MGHRTLSLGLVLRALFLDGEAYDRLREDDNPFVEGLFLVAVIGLGTALLSLAGQLAAWASLPSLDAIQNVILSAYRQMPWWPQLASNEQAMSVFERIWDLSWRLFPLLFGAPSPTRAVFNLLAWPATALVTWLVYGLLAFGFARLLRGRGTLSQTLGTTALATTPLLLRGLGLIPFFSAGGVIAIWALICRYMAVRSAHDLPPWRAFWATVLPYAVYLLVWLVAAFAVATAIAGLIGVGR